jgi:phosphoribosylamine---glycine ligase
MKVLIVGGGGREHALAWRLSHSPGVRRLVAAPGNAGIAALADCVPIRADDIEGIVGLAAVESADLVVVGPETPLVAGLADRLRSVGIPVFGPNAAAARIEGSKAWAKELMRRGGIPTARSETFTEVGPAVAFVDELGGGAVVKADGLAGGKGVTVAPDLETAAAALRRCLEADEFGAAGATVVVEEVLEGPEVSAFALCDGRAIAPLVLGQDFKRALDGDEGPNTGGMGAFSPVPFVDAETEEEIWDLARRTVDAMGADGVSYRGVLYLGLMLTAEGPKVLEYNCRFGDPETEVVMPRLRADLAEVLLACATGDLADRKIGWSEEAAVTVVLASGGYPGPYETGTPIEGLEDAARVEGAVVFHAGTARRDGRVVTAGGRVLAVSSLGSTIEQARIRAYEACSRLSFDGMRYRTDIAARAARDQGSAGSVPAAGTEPPRDEEER